MLGCHQWASALTVHRILLLSLQTKSDFPMTDPIEQRGTLSQVLSSIWQNIESFPLPYTLLNLMKLKCLMLNTIDFPPTRNNSYTLKSSLISQLLLFFWTTFDCCILSCIEKWQSKGENTAKKIMLRSSALPNNYLESKVLVTKQCLLKVKFCWLFRTQVYFSWTAFPFHTKTKTCVITVMFM